MHAARPGDLSLEPLPGYTGQLGGHGFLGER